jgi:hypothetical protein
MREYYERWTKAELIDYVLKMRGELGLLYKALCAVTEGEE